MPSEKTLQLLVILCKRVSDDDSEFHKDFM